MDFPKSMPDLGLVDGRFTDGTLDGTVAPSVDSAVWANAVTDEILNVIRAGGLTPKETEVNQMAQAIMNILPARLGTCEIVSDWNKAVKSGWYGSNASTINGPLVSAFAVGRVDAYNSDWIVQTVRLFFVASAADTATYQRQYSTSTNGWSAWYRIRQSEDELFATDAEATALAATKKAISPAQLGTMFGRSHAAAGYQKLPGGLILQWGTYAENGLPLQAGGNTTRNLTFPIAFPTQTFQVVSCSTHNYVFAIPINISPSGFTASFSCNSGPLNISINYVAIGR